jgi:hypothetical protein
MVPLFGTYVSEHGYRIGRLTGVEMERDTCQVRQIFFTADGDLGSHAQARPLAVVLADHFAGDIVLRAFATPAEATAEPLSLSQAMRVVRGSRQIGRLSGVEVSPDHGALTAIFGRQHWWTRRFRLDVAGLDFSTPGEVRADTMATHAA